MPCNQVFLKKPPQPGPGSHLHCVPAPHLVPGTWWMVQDMDEEMLLWKCEDSSKDVLFPLCSLLQFLRMDYLLLNRF